MSKALVCGASKGIGRAIAMQLAADGHSVTALARDKDALASLQSELGEGHKTISLDFSNHAQVKDFLGTEDMSYDILICNSGGPKGGPLAEADTTEFLAAFEQHLFFNHQIMQAALPHMKQKKSGRIITILSTSVKAPIPNLGVSNVLRGAMASWVKTLANELGPFGITVNNVLPGFTKTDRMDSLSEARAKKSGQSAEDVKQDWLKTIPLNRFAEASELANAVSFLASDKAAYINGINLPVDGGRLPTL